MAHWGYADAHWEAYVTDARDPERVVSACGSTIPGAVAQCFLAMREARRAADLRPPQVEERA